MAHLIDDLRTLIRLFQLLGLGPLLGFIWESRVMKALLEAQVARAPEGFPLDAGLLKGREHQIDLRQMNFAERLFALRHLQDDSVSRDLELFDVKSMDVGLSVRNLIHANYSLFTTALQRENASFLLICFRGRPGIVAVVPTPSMQVHATTTPATSFDAPVPMPFAGFSLSISKLTECLDWFPSLRTTQASSRMPGTVISVKKWPVKATERGEFLWSGADRESDERAAFVAFERLYMAVKSSAEASNHGFKVDFTPIMPYGGDARMGPYTVELKERLVSEPPDSPNIILKIGLYGEKRPHKLLRQSPFNPSRSWDFLVLFGNDFLYCIPWKVAGDNLTAWWTGSTKVELPKKVVAPFREQLNGDWFSRVYENIIKVFPARRSSNIDLTSYRLDDLYALTLDREKNKGANEDADDVSGLDDVHQEDVDQNKGRKKTPQRPRKRHYDPGSILLSDCIERLNIECARHQRGVALPTTMRAPRVPSRLATTYVFADYQWSDEHLDIFNATGGNLPIVLSGAQLSAYQPLLPLNAARITHNVLLPANEPGHFTYVSGLNLFSKEWPCLWIIDPMPSSRQKFPHSHLLIPSEFIDKEKILSDWSKRHGRTFSSYGQFHEYALANQSGTSVTRWETVKLEKYLKRGAVLQEFMVREGAQTHHAIISFIKGHVAGSRRLSWYESKSNPMYAEDWYLKWHKDVQQHFADQWLESARGEEGDDVDDGGFSDVSDEDEDEDY